MPISPSQPSNGCNVTKQEAEQRRGQGIIESQYGACMRAQHQFWVDGKLTAEEYAAEMDREWAAAISGANDVEMWIEEFPEDQKSGLVYCTLHGK